MNSNLSNLHKRVYHSFIAARDQLERTAFLFTLLSFTYMSAMPASALAYSVRLEEKQQPVVFIIPYGPIQGKIFTNKAASNPSSLDLKVGMHVSAWASAYSSDVAQTDGDPFTTASGTRVHAGTAASNFLPLGTKITMKGSPYIIEDRMNSRYNDRYTVDIWQPSQEAAFGFGVRLVTFEITELPGK